MRFRSRREQRSPRGRQRPGALALATLAIVLCGMPARPVAAQPSAGEPAGQAIRQFASASGEQLRARYESEKKEYRLYARPFDRDLAACLGAWAARRDPDARQQALRALEAALAPWSGISPQDLAARVTDQGSRDEVNLDLRDACLHFAQLHRLTGDARAADKSVALLARFMDAVPRWPIWSPYYGPAASRKPLPPDQPSSYSGEFAAGPWGLWIYMDLIMATPLLESWSMLREGRLDDAFNARARGFFQRFIDIQRMHDTRPDYSNMDAFQIRGVLDFGRLLPDAALVHEGMDHLETLYRIGFFPDGWWHEGSSSYHSDLQRGLRAIIDALPSDYSDPPGFAPRHGTRWDHEDLRARVSRPSDRADAVIREMQLPDGRVLAVHDSNWDDRAGVQRSPSPVSTLFGAMGHATLASVGLAGETQVTLHYGASGTHAHHDSLAITLWDKGREVVSETAYRPIDGSGSTREWQASTAGHATVVVDELDQSANGRLRQRVRRPTPEDAVEGVPDWPWRWSSCGVEDFGTLRLFSRDFDQVQVVEADAAAAYDSVAPVTTYRRTIALVRVDGADTYVCDIFRVRGGRTHDFMLHGCLQEIDALRTTVPMQAMPGTLHGMIGDLGTGTTDASWGSVFGTAPNAQVISMFAAAPGTQVITGKAPAMRRLGEAPFLIARRSGPESAFVVVHEVVRGSARRVRGVECMPIKGSGVIAVKVTLDSGTDLILSGDGPSSEAVVEGDVDFRGGFAHVRRTGVGANWAFLLDGDRLHAGTLAIDGNTFLTGEISGVDRLDAGRPTDGFVTSTALPPGPALANQVLLVDPPTLPRWAYLIDSVRGVDGASEIIVTSDPGLDVRADVAKQLHFPCWGGRGVTRFRVPGSALLMRADAQSAWSFVGTGSARGSTGAGSPK